MIAIIVTFATLWTGIIAPPGRIGCSDTAVEQRSVIPLTIYACSGTIDSGGVYGDDAEALCGENYHVCESAEETFNLGLTDAICDDIAQTTLEFFATQETSSGSGKCYSYRNGNPADLGTVYNDVWGCAHPENTLYVYGSGPTNNQPFPCGPLDYWVGQGTKGAWELPEDYDHTQEAVNYVLTDPAYGGVLCCKDPCAKRGLGFFGRKHYCQCQEGSTCGSGPYCHFIHEIGTILGEWSGPLTSDMCDDGEVCCCGCPDCDNFSSVGFPQ